MIQRITCRATHCDYMIDIATLMSITAVVGLLIFAFNLNWKVWQWWCFEGLHIPLHLENIDCRPGYPLLVFLEFITLLIIDPMLCDCECPSWTQIGFCAIIQNRNWEMHLHILFSVLRWSDWVCLILVLPWRCGSWWRQNVGEPILSWSWPVTWPRKGGHGGTAQHLQWVICHYTFKYMYYMCSYLSLAWQQTCFFQCFLIDSPRCHRNCNWGRGQCFSSFPYSVYFVDYNTVLSPFRCVSLLIPDAFFFI